MKIKILDPVDCEVIQGTKTEKAWLRRLLSYERTFYRRKQYGGEKKEYRTSLFRHGRFPTGFLTRVLNATETDGEIIYIQGTSVPLSIRPELSEPQVPGFDLRPHQIDAIKTMALAQRGVIDAPTGSGKTVTMMGFVSMFPKTKFLIVVHTQDLLVQTHRNFMDAGFAKVGRLGAGTADLSGRIVVATRQSLVESYTVHNEVGPDSTRMRLKDRHRDWFEDLGGIILDEAHLFGGMDGQNTTLFRSTLCPMRFGFTGTVPNPNTEQGAALEGMVGPVIAKLTHKEAIDMDIMSTARLELKPVPYQKSIGKLKRYADIHTEGIVHNRTRNKIIMSRALSLASEGCRSLVFVESLNHGDNLLEMAKLLGLDALYVNGEWDVAARTAVKDALAAGELDCVICTKVWREGVDIPNLGAVLLAGGGKAQLSTLQAIGRGLRKAPGKEYAVIVDLLDPYDYTAKHTVQRLSIYHQMGWLQ